MPRIRPIRNQEIRKRILILAEGVTELIYFKAIKRDVHLKRKLSAARIIPFDSNKNTGKELVDVAKLLKNKAIKEKNPYDAMFVVLDKDGYTKHPETFNKATANRIRVIFTSVSFEFWFLLHFEYTTRAFLNCDQLVTYLKTHIVDYEKTTDYYETHLKEKIDIAIKRGRQVREFFQNDIDRGKRIYELDCYTDMDELVMFLINL